MHDPTPPSDERKVATVRFADLVGSTAPASEEDAERVRADRLTWHADQTRALLAS
jgi:hypothetical protein